MKILSNDFNSNLPTKLWPTKGGTAQFAKLFSKLITERGHEWVGIVDSYVDVGVSANRVDYKKNKYWWVVNFPKEFVNNNFTLLKKYKKPSVTGKILIDKIIEIIKEERPDVVFLNGNSCFAWVILQAAYIAKVPIVALHAGIWSLEIDLYSDFFTPTGIKVLKEMELDFATLPNCNVFLNETSKEYFVKNIYKIAKEKIQIIPLPCESGEINKNRKTKINKNINVGLVARWDRIKNHHAFLAVAKELIKINKGYKFFAITNVPDTESFKEFKEEYRRNIKVFPSMDRKQLKKFYQKMDFMMLPSIFDVSPHVVPEAALEGAPTFISKNVGYAKIYTDNGLKNYIVDFSKPKMAASKIESMKGKGFPLKFVRILKNLHDPKLVMDKFEELFKKIIV